MSEAVSEIAAEPQMGGAPPVSPAVPAAPSAAGAAGGVDPEAEAGSGQAAASPGPSQAVAEGQYMPTAGTGSRQAATTPSSKQAEAGTGQPAANSGPNKANASLGSMPWQQDASSLPAGTAVQAAPKLMANAVSLVWDLVIRTGQPSRLDLLAASGNPELRCSTAAATIQAGSAARADRLSPFDCQGSIELQVCFIDCSQNFGLLHNNADRVV